MRPYPVVTLAKARKLRLEAKATLVEGTSIIQKQATKVANQLTSENTFKEVATEWFINHMSDKSETHKARPKRVLEAELYPPIGNMPVADIAALMILAALKKVEKRGYCQALLRRLSGCFWLGQLLCSV